MTDDNQTAAAFASSWNALPSGSVYTREQFEEWMSPISAADVQGREVLELGCGNGSLLVHLASWWPSKLEGVDLGASVDSARHNMKTTGFDRWSIEQADLTTYTSPGFDIVYCIGVLHHLADPKRGFDAVTSNTKPGGRFHCWVYAREGNAIIRWLVEPLRRVSSRLPWWFTKYALATPLVIPFFLYAKALSRLPSWSFLRFLPLYEYSQWIAKRRFPFFRHVAFDQLVTPRTVYLARETIEQWLQQCDRIVPGSQYLVFRNGNSWKFGAETVGTTTQTAGHVGTS